MKIIRDNIFFSINLTLKFHLNYLRNSSGYFPLISIHTKSHTLTHILKSSQHLSCPLVRAIKTPFNCREGMA